MLTGELWVHLVNEYVNALNNEVVPTISTAFDNVVTNALNKYITVNTCFSLHLKFAKGSCWQI